MGRRFKYLGPQDEITIRHMTFVKGKAVAVDDDDLRKKIAALDYFAEVKAGRKNVKDKG